ncbi:MAG: SET domain-containing protein-lysine N-methyltransferase [Ferruginibacter sp.]
MALLEKQLVVKRSTIPGSGKGLFTKISIDKGTDIVEYKGRISNWEDANHAGGDNAYIFYINRNHVIDALKRLTALARYANDALGLKKVKGMTNNCIYVTKEKKVYIKSTKDIAAGSEIFVDYGKDYWDVIRKNKSEK